MRWISKEPPIYVWGGDTWYNERDKLVYTADLQRQFWHYFDDLTVVNVIPFPKKTKVMGYDLK